MVERAEAGVGEALEQRNLEAVPSGVDGSQKRPDLQVVRTVDHTADKVRDVMDGDFHKNSDAFVAGLPKVNGAVNFSKLQKIGSGGTHDIYQDPNNPKFVVKINRGHLAADANDFSRAKGFIDNKDRENKALYGAFGSDSCARERMVVAKGTFSSKRRLFGPREAKVQDVLLIVQERNEALAQKDVVDFGFDYNHQWKSGIKKRMGKDQEFRDKVVEFLLKFKDYFNSTGNFIDLVGEKNVVFYRDSAGRWQYKIGSVLKGETKDNFLRVYQKMLVDPKSLKSASVEEKTNFNNGIAAVKCLNEMGMWLGIGTIACLPVTDKGINSGR